MKNHPGYENIEAMRKAGCDPKIGEWPGDPGYGSVSGEGLCERSDPPSPEAERRLSEENLERIGREVVAAAKAGCEKGINRDLQNAVFDVNRFLAEASTYGLYADIEALHLDVVGSTARGRRINIKLSKVIK